MDECRTFVEVLRRRAEQCPDRTAFRFLGDRGGDEEAWTYARLDRRARAVAARVGEQAAPGDRVVLCYPPGLEFIAGLFGCFYAGAVAVPVYPPRPSRSAERLRGVLADARPALALTSSEALSLVESVQGGPAVPWLATDLLPDERADGWRARGQVDREALAVLQYTSGSTGAPRGVMLSHGNLLANQRHIGGAFGHHVGIEANVSWLPVYHDMGLIGNVLHPVYVGMPLVQMSPLTFLQRPLRWLEAISRYRAHTSGGPNFAYDLCVQRARPEHLVGLDLSSWRVAYVGAEPVRAATLEAFARAFEPCGFSPAAFLPCYGLAEATLYVTGSRGRKLFTASTEALARGVAVAAMPAAEGTVLVSSGTVPDDAGLAIVDPASGAVLPEGQVGEVWARGPQVAQGYWGAPEATQAAFGARLPDGTGPFLRTGDLGFLREGHLYLAGRIKDTIIVDGRNVYPQDIEWTAQASHPRLAGQAGAAFGVEGERGEQLVVVHEVERGLGRDGLAAVTRALSAAVAAGHGVPPRDVVLVPRGRVPRTSSGKVQRSLCRRMYLAGELAPPGAEG